MGPSRGSPLVMDARDASFQTRFWGHFPGNTPVCSRREGLEPCGSAGALRRAGTNPRAFIDPGSARPRRSSPGTVCAVLPLPSSPRAHFTAQHGRNAASGPAQLNPCAARPRGWILFPPQPSFIRLLPALTRLCCLAISLHTGYLEECFLKIASRFLRCHSVQL